MDRLEEQLNENRTEKVMFSDKRMALGHKMSNVERMTMVDNKVNAVEEHQKEMV